MASEENRQLIAEKAQRAYEEEQYAKDVTRHEQETEVTPSMLGIWQHDCLAAVALTACWHTYAI